MNDVDINAALVVGASGGIGSAVVDQLMKIQRYTHVVTVSHKLFVDLGSSEIDEFSNLLALETDYSAESINTLMANLSSFKGCISRVVICNGILHDDQKDIFPEKKLEDISEGKMMHVFRVNALLPLLFLKDLVALVKGEKRCVISVLSARVGSIEDNRLGGWYSYRASKAALNMLVKTAAIEYERRAKNVRFLLFHPGTVDTNLSKPFQSKSSTKLMQPSEVAMSLIKLMDRSDTGSNIEFIDWEGKKINW
ncbi:MAG: SDR family NAD(P)-dependent oxidoreductase [Pseudomonadota bacterium]|nr:SDR family NAD(P)-dependent oxidoreductase [Pseudomonadota bacterium]